MKVACLIHEQENKESLPGDRMDDVGEHLVQPTCSKQSQLEQIAQDHWKSLALSSLLLPEDT